MPHVFDIPLNEVPRYVIPLVTVELGIRDNRPGLPRKPAQSSGNNQHFALHILRRESCKTTDVLAQGRCLCKATVAKIPQPCTLLISRSSSAL